ncbi:D-aspartate oxidase [Pseudolycoriella hygida]|uniref:D-aspartate oxidase n=1 Tax=Pseudolycoriella hygida TaxID=35572 RepID=A0A9Q0RX68_9DIPT|nr:D-aspartate oxidase [Pseudolycoriella hygida]
MVQKIAIIGAGVVGLSCAVKISEFFQNENIDVCLISEKFTPNTTGDGSAGLWGPYLIGDTAADNINKWSKESHEFFHDLWKNGKAAEVGISLINETLLTQKPEVANPCWSQVVFGFTPLSYKQLDLLSKEHSVRYTAGANYVTFTCEPTYLLPYLMRRFKSAGGKVLEKRVNSFDDLLDQYDIIINCTGLGAKTLVNDPKLTPIRGQVARVEASWIFQSTQNDNNYIIPNMETVILGGTAQVNDYNENISDDDSKFIRSGCSDLNPSTVNSTLRKEWAGLRPGRDTVRIEAETFHTGNGKGRTVIHNYGHGGSGVTTAWGCASDVLELVKESVSLKCKL